MNKNIKRISSGAAAVVMALTTAVYVPGFANTASAAENEPVECAYRAGSNIINEDTWENWKGTDNDATKVVLTGTEGCSYEVGTLGRDIVIAENANIALTFKAAAVYTGTITNNGTLTISGTDVKDIANKGTLTISDITLKGDLTTDKGTVTVKSGTVEGKVEATGEGKIVITGGTFDGKVTANGKVSATGGTYKIGAYTDTDELEAIIRGIRASDTYDAYKISDDYYSLETNIASKAVTFELSSIVEDTDTEITGASVEGSNTEFEYDVKLVTFSTDAEGKTTETVTETTDITLSAATVANGGKLTIKGDKSSAKDTAYRLTATSTIDNSVKKSVDFTVTSALTDATIAKTTDTTTYNAKDTFVHRDDSTDEQGQAVAGTDVSEANVFLSNSGSLVFTVTPVTADASVAEYSSAILVDGVELTEEKLAEFDVATVTFDADAKTVTVAPSANKPGTFTVRVTATATDGTAKSRDLNITVQDVLGTASVKNKTIYFMETAGEDGETIVYPTMSVEDFIAKAEPSYTTVAGYPETEGVSALDDLSYTLVNKHNARAFTLNTDEETGKVVSITPNALAKTQDDSRITLRITDNKSGVEKDVDVSVKVVAALDDIEVAAAESIIEGTTAEKSVEALIASALEDAGYDTSAYTEKSHSVKFYAADDQGKITKKAGSILSLGTETVGEGADATEVEVIKAGTGAATEFAVIEYVADVNGIETSAKITYQFDIKAELTQIALLDADGKQLDGAIVNKDGWSATTSDDLVAGETKTYTLDVKSSSIKLSKVEFSFEGEAVVSAGNFDAGYNTFSVTAGEAGKHDGKVTIKGIADEDGDNEETFQFTININTAEYEELNQVIPNGIYTIAASKDNGYVLDVKSASTKEGATVQLYKANDTTAQKFVITASARPGYYTIQNLKSGLYVATDYEQGNSLIQIDPTNNRIRMAGLTMYWYAHLNSDGTITFNQSSIDGPQESTSLAMDIRFNEMKNENEVRGYKGNNTAAQKFVLTSVATATTEDGDYDNKTFKIASAKKDDMVLDAKYGGAKNGTNVWLYDSNYTDEYVKESNPSQEFTFHAIGNGFYTIEAGTTPEDAELPLVLDVMNAKDANEANVQLYESNGTIAQQWMIVENDDDTISIISRINGRALDLRWSGTSNGTNVQIYEQNGTIAQKFILKEVEE